MSSDIRYPGDVVDHVLWRIGERKSFERDRPYLAKTLIPSARHIGIQRMISLCPTSVLDELSSREPLFSETAENALGVWAATLHGNSVQFTRTMPPLSEALRYSGHFDQAAKLITAMLSLRGPARWTAVRRAAGLVKGRFNPSRLATDVYLLEKYRDTRVPREWNRQFFG